MAKLVGTRSTGLLLIALVAAGCSSGDSSRAESAASSSATPSSPASASSSPSATPSGHGARNCLFTIAEVSRVVAGKWVRHPQGERACVYTSDRGAVFGTSTVNQAIEPGLRAARSACLPGVKPIAIARGGSVCVQRQGSDEYVAANLGSGGRLWVVLMAPRSVRPYKPELSAMMALAGAAPK